MILLFVHGWGFNASFWDPVVERLPDRKVVVWDRGYFGAPSEPPPNGPYIAIAHSFGTMRVVADAPADCRGLVAMNGFDRFAAREGKQGVPPRLIDRMLRNVDRDPHRVVSEFRARVGNRSPFDEPEPERLKADLARLRDGDETDRTAKWDRPILSIQGGTDPLLSVQMRETAFSSAPDLTKAVFPDGEHLLPLTDPDYCARMIEQFTERVS